MIVHFYYVCGFVILYLALIVSHSCVHFRWVQTRVCVFGWLSFTLLVASVHFESMELILRGGWFLICVAICSWLRERIFTMGSHIADPVDMLIEFDVMHDFHVLLQNMLYKSKQIYVWMFVTEFDHWCARVYAHIWKIENINNWVDSATAGNMCFSDRQSVTHAHAHAAYTFENRHFTLLDSTRSSTNRYLCNLWHSCLLATWNGK